MVYSGIELDVAVAEMMEPRPEAVSARTLREQTPGFQWVLCHDVYSEGGWWVAEIGTEHGPPEADGAPVEWRPAHEVSGDLSTAMKVVEHMLLRGYDCELYRVDDQRGREVCVAWFHNGPFDVEGLGKGATFPDAICKAALKSDHRMKWRKGDA